MRRFSALAVSASVLLVAGAALVACTVPEPAPSASPSTSTPPSAEPSESATPSSSPSPDATPVDIACDALTTRQTMYDFNPNFSLLASWTPDAGTPAAEALAASGVACRWQNDSSGDTIDVSVAAPDAATLAAKESSSGTAADYGADAGFFTVSGGVGQATAISGPYWIVVRSVYFAQAGDADVLVRAAVSALP
jgi:hypothetical protein